MCISQAATCRAEDGECGKASGVLARPVVVILLNGILQRFVQCIIIGDPDIM